MEQYEFEELDGQWIISGCIVTDANRVYPSSESDWRDYYNFVWVQRGKASACSDDWRLQLSDGLVCCTQPARIFFEADREAVVWQLKIHKPLLTSLIRDIPVVANWMLLPALTIDTAPGWLTTSEANLLRIMQGFREDESFLRLLLRQWLKSFISYLAGRLTFGQEVAERRKSTELSMSFLAAVKSSCRKFKTVTEFARELYVTPGYLNKTVKRTTGFPASYHIQQSLVTEARTLARDGSLSMKAIAYELGFDDSCYFSKYFKKATGANFTDYRKNVRGDF